MTIVPYSLGFDPASLPPYPGYMPSAGTFFTLGNRIYVVKAIRPRDADPSDNTGAVNIPVLVRIKFRDGGDRFWDKVLTFDVVDGLSVNGARSFHVAQVYNTGDLAFGSTSGNPDPSQSIDVERIDTYAVFDPVDQVYDAPGQGWKSVFSIDTVTGEGGQDKPGNFGPPNGNYVATHVARWFKTDDAGNVTNPDLFIDSEYVDQARIRDIYRGQFWDFLYTLKNNWVNPSFNGDGTPAPFNPVPASQLGT